MKPGRVTNARWLSTGSSVLVLYSRTNNPGEKLTKLVTYIQKVYLPSYFMFKAHPSLHQAQEIIFKKIQFIKKYFKNDVIQIVKPVVNKNAYPFMTENLLYACLCSNEKVYEDKAVSKIIEIRRECKEDVIREPAIPSLDWNAANWVNLVDWKKTKFFEPWLTKKYSEEDLLLRKTADLCNEFPFIPSHTQGTVLHLTSFFKDCKNFSKTST